MSLRPINLLVRARRVAPERRRLIVEAATALLAASAALALLPFRRSIELGSVPLAAATPGTNPHEIADAVRRAAELLPWRLVCIHQGLALQRMLRRRGVDARLHYGIGEDSRALAAHVWVSAGGQVLLGADEAANFAEVAVFPR